MITRRNALTLAALPFGLAVSDIARAQSYPAKLIASLCRFRRADRPMSRRVSSQNV